MNLGGPKSREIIYGLSKLFPFAPLINGLYVLSERDTVYEYFLPQITSPLYTIIKEMSGEKDECKVFEHLLEFLPFFGSFQYTDFTPSTIFKFPYMQVGYEVFFKDYSKKSIVMLDSDFRGTDHIQLEFVNPDSRTLSNLHVKNPIFSPVSVMAARRQNRLCFIRLKANMGLFLSYSAAKAVKATDVIAAAKNADRAHITDVRIFDVYEGENLPEGKKSLALAMTFQPVENTFSDTDSEVLMKKVEQAVKSKFNAELRSA